jgi:hypothetical protein
VSGFVFKAGPPKACEAASIKQIEALANQKAAAITGAKSVGGGTIKVFTAPHVPFNYYIKDSAALRKILARFGVEI